jgi:hypothetical protein
LIKKLSHAIGVQSKGAAEVAVSRRKEVPSEWESG